MKLLTFLKAILSYIFLFKVFFVFWYFLKTPNLKFLNLVIQQYNISSSFWNFEYFLNRLCPIFLFLKMRLVYWHCIKTPKSVFLILLMPQQNILLKLLNSKKFLILRCPICLFLKVVFINKYNQKNPLFPVPKPGDATVVLN